MGCVRKAEHAAKEVFSNPITEAVTDIGLAATGQGWAIPIANAAETKLGGGSNKQALMAGGEALAGQEALSAIGIGEGNTAFNSALGITGDNPAGTGLPDIGGGIEKAAGSVFGNNAGAATQGAEGAANIASTAAGNTPVSSPTGVTGGGVGASAGAAAPPSGIDSSFASGLDEGKNLTSLSAGTPLSSVAGGANPGTQQVENTGSFLGNLKNQIVGNPMASLTGVGLAADALKQELGPEPKGTRQLQNIAGQQLAQGGQLEGYLSSGTLPPGLQAGIDQNLKAAQAKIRSEYAARGMSGSSAEQQDLASAAQNAQAQGAAYAMQLLNTGIGETGMAAGLYQDMLKNTLAQDQQLGSAFGSFAGALGGGTGQKQKSTTES